MHTTLREGTYFVNSSGDVVRNTQATLTMKGSQSDDCLSKQASKARRVALISNRAVARHPSSGCSRCSQMTTSLSLPVLLQVAPLFTFLDTQRPHHVSFPFHPPSERFRLRRPHTTSLCASRSIPDHHHRDIPIRNIFRSSPHMARIPDAPS